MPYIALREVHAGKVYAIGETVPDELVDDALVESGAVAFSDPEPEPEPEPEVEVDPEPEPEPRKPARGKAVK